MKKIEEMISRLCPEGVKYEKLILCADILYGYPFDAKLFTEDESFIPLIRIRDVVPGLSNTFYKGEYEEKYIILKGDILVGMDGNFNLGKWKGSNGILCQRTLKITSNDEKKCLNNYLFHLLGPLFKQIEEETPGGSVKHLSAKVINKIEIPLPHPDIQKEIVRILDNFTSLQENLEEELKLRQKQYEYYREKLLTFEEGECEWSCITPKCKVNRGVRVVRKDLHINGIIPVYQNSLIPLGYSDTSNCRSNTAYIISAGAAGEVGYSEVDFWAADDCFWISTDETVVDKYLYHWLKLNEHFFKSHIRGGAIKRLSRDSIENLRTPFPSPSRQQEIVNILDKFEAMIANIKEEIELRKKQYEFYREKLLTF